MITLVPYNNKESKKKSNKKYYLNHKDIAIANSVNWNKIHKERHDENCKNRRKKEKALVLEHYGAFCHNLNCPIPKNKMSINCLQIDHINNNGNEHRKKYKGMYIYHFLVKNNYPEGYQVLCIYCNWLKQYNE